MACDTVLRLALCLTTLHLLVGNYAKEISVPSVSTQASPPMKEGCPRKEDIHPCECFEIPNETDPSKGTESVAFCKTIRNIQVLQNAFKGMRGHIINFLVLDSCKLPPFPNGLLFEVDVKWMEILNTTVQIKQNFAECAKDCW